MEVQYCYQYDKLQVFNIYQYYCQSRIIIKIGLINKSLELSDTFMINSTVSVSRLLKADQQKIWEKISTPGIVHHYHPFCKENPVVLWNEENSVDEIIYENNLVYRREFNTWLEGIGYDLIIVHKERILAIVIWRINKIDDEFHELQISLKPQLKGILPKIPSFLRWIPYYVFIRWQMKNYLGHVLKGFENYIITGNQIKPNQFGKHRFYSKK